MDKQARRAEHSAVSHDHGRTELRTRQKRRAVGIGSDAWFRQTGLKTSENKSLQMPNRLRIVSDMSLLYKKYYAAAEAVCTSELDGAAWLALVDARDAAAKQWIVFVEAGAEVCTGEWAAARRMARRMAA
jgi:hypothetical protein